MKIQEFRERFRSKPHPLRPFFKDRGITVTELANFIGRDSWTVGRYLSGVLRIPPEVEEKLQGLAEELKE